MTRRANLVFAALITLGVLLSLASVAAAAEPAVEDRQAQVTKLQSERQSAEAARLAADKAYQQKTAEITKLKAQPSSWSRDRKLQGLLRESKDMAAKLDTLAAKVRKLDGELAAGKKQLLAAIDRELAASPSAERRASLEKKRATLAPAVKAIRIGDDRIDPGDDPEDLEFKADALERAEKELATEEKRLARRAAYYGKQAKLARARSRADEQDVFRDDQPRKNKSSGGGNEAAVDADPSPADPASPPPDQGEAPPAGFDTDDGATGDPGLTGVGTPGTGRDETAPPIDVSVDPAVVLADVVDPGTLDELRRAERSGDPESRAKAAERARKELATRIEKLRQRRAEMEKRAKLLRDQGE